MEEVTEAPVFLPFVSFGSQSSGHSVPRVSALLCSFLVRREERNVERELLAFAS